MQDNTGIDGDTLGAVVRVTNLAYMFVHEPELLIQAANRKDVDHGQEKETD